MWPVYHCVFNNILKKYMTAQVCPCWACQVSCPITWIITLASSLRKGPGLCEPAFLAWIYQCDFLPLLLLSSFLPSHNSTPEVNIICRTFDSVCHGGWGGFKQVSSGGQVLETRVPLLLRKVSGGSWKADNNPPSTTPAWAPPTRRHDGVVRNVLSQEGLGVPKKKWYHRSWFLPRTTASRGEITLCCL